MHACAQTLNVKNAWNEHYSCLDISHSPVNSLCTWMWPNRAAYSNITWCELWHQY